MAMLRNSRWFNRASVNFDSREMLLESEITTKLHELDDFEKQCKELEKALKRFAEATSATKKGFMSLTEWYLTYLDFHYGREKNSWLVQVFLADPVLLLNANRRSDTVSEPRASGMGPKLNRLSAFALSVPNVSSPQQHKRSSSHQLSQVSAPAATESFKRSSSSFEFSSDGDDQKLTRSRSSSDFKRIITLQQEIGPWRDLLEQVLKLRTDLAENMDYLLLQAVIQSSKEYIKKVNEKQLSRRAYEKAKSEQASARQKLEREKSKVLDSEQTGKYSIDIHKLFGLERDKVRCELIYEETSIELMDLLTSEKRNVDLGQSILKYLETQKRYYIRTTNLLDAHKSSISSVGQWEQNITNHLQKHEETREGPLELQKAEENRMAWKRLAQIIIRPNGFLLPIILEVLGPLCTVGRRQELLESIVYLFVSQLEPFPPELADVVHLATKSIDEEEYYYSNFAAHLLQFMHAHYSVIADNLRRHNSDEFFVFTAALSLVVSKSEIGTAAL